MFALYGRILYKARRAQNLTQGDVANIMGCTTSMVSMIEKGVREPSIKPTHDLAEKLRMDFDYLLAAWKMSQPLRIQLHTEDRAGRRFWFHHVAKREGLGITLKQFDEMMVEHVDPHHLRGARKK